MTEPVAVIVPGPVFAMDNVCISAEFEAITIWPFLISPFFEFKAPELLT